MSTHTVAASVRLDRPAEAVAPFVLDWGNDVRWRRQVRGFVVEPAGVAVEGQRLVEELAFGGLTFRTPTMVVEARPLRASFEGGSARIAVSGSREVVPDGAGCWFLTTTVVEGLGVTRRFTPLLAPSFRRSHVADVERLDGVLGALALS